MGGGSEERVISTAPFQAMSELLRVGDTTEVDEGSFHHQDMGDLMSTPWKHMSNFPGKKRSAMCAAQRPTLVTYIRAMRKNQPSGPPWTLMKSSETELHGRQDTTQAKPQERACSWLPVLRSGEPAPLCHDEGRDARNTDDGCR